MATTKISRLAANALVFCLTLYPALAQDPQLVGGPAMGFVVDEGSGIRPVLGVPGAAALGSPVLPATGFDSIVISPQRDFALALTARERQLVILRSLSVSPSADALTIPPGASRIALSPAGDTAVLYYAGRVEVLTGLPDSPTSSWGLDLPVGLAALAVSDGGSAVLAATEGGPSSVFLLTQDAGYRSLLLVAGLPSLAFLGKNLDAVVADGVSSQVFVVRDPKGNAQIMQLGGQAEGVSRPVAVAAGSGRVFVANAEPGGVVSLSLAGEEAQLIPCGCTPTSLERLADGATFRLGETAQGPVWLLDSRSSPPRIVFVPNQSRQRREVIPLRRLPVRRGGAL